MKVRDVTLCASSSVSRGAPLITFLAGMAPTMGLATRQVSCLLRTTSSSSLTAKAQFRHYYRRRTFTRLQISRDRDTVPAETDADTTTVSPDQVTDDKWRQYERLFSNVNQATLKHEPGNVTSAVLLIAGTTIGAGILAIPAVTRDAGFVASSATCVLCWLYMVATGLLIAEVNINTMCELGSGGVSIVSMAQRTIGNAGVGLASFFYLVIHYALLVAYVARASDIISNAIGTPLWCNALLFSGAFGGLCFFGSQRVIGNVNGALVAGIVVTFGTLVIATGNIDLESLLRANFGAIPRSVPVIALAFVYQNVVPVVCTNLEGDVVKIRTAIVVGTAIPLAMFIVWDAVILGNVSLIESGTQSLADPLIQLRSSSGIISPLVETFSLLAIATSYIGFVLGLTDFLADLFKLPNDRQAFPYMLAILPPVVLALLSPNIFFEALDFAGAYGVLVLFGIFPAAMAWSQRYSKVMQPLYLPSFLPGGRVMLGLIIAGAGFIITSQIVRTIQL